MIQILNNNKEDVLSIKVSGEITKDHYDIIQSLLEQKRDNEGSLKIYCEFEDFKEFDTDALGKDIRFDVNQYKNISKIAIVGQKDWLKWITKLTKPFSSANIKYFDLHEKEKARSWIHE